MRNSKEIRDPGTWFVVRLRAVKSYKQVACVLACKNAFHAGHNGWSRKWRFVRNPSSSNPSRIRKFKTRQWKLERPSNFRLGYRFEKLKDARAGVRTKIVKEWTEKHTGFAELVEVTGCLVLANTTSEKVVHRMFRKGTNEMVILALESL
jgi:hypothetical protein